MGSKYSECPLDVDMRNKLSSVGSGLEPEIRQWIEGMTGERIQGTFGKGLKDGIILCKLANRIRPGICPKIMESKMPFAQMENINAYLSAAGKLGVPSSDLFMTVDLFEEKNVGQVIRNLDVLRRVTKTGGVKGAPAPVTVSASTSPSMRSPSSPASPSFKSSSPSFSSSPSSPRSTPSYGSSSPRTTTPSSPSFSSSSSPRSTPSYGSSSPKPSTSSSFSSSSSSSSYGSSSSPKPSTTSFSSSSSSSYGSPKTTTPKVPVGVHNPAPSSDPLCPLDKDLKDKLSLVGSGGLEQDIRNWVERVSGEKFPDRSFGKSLKNGVILCKLANKIRPGICKVQNSPAPFVQMENINSYLNAARQFGVPASDLFMTVDLYEEKNVGQVIRNLDVLRRVTGR